MVVKLQVLTIYISLTVVVVSEFFFYVLVFPSLVYSVCMSASYFQVCWIVDLDQFLKILSTFVILITPSFLGSEPRAFSVLTKPFTIKLCPALCTNFYIPYVDFFYCFY